MSAFKPGPSDSDSEDIELEDFLKKNELLIRQFAHSHIPYDHLHFEVEDLIQRSRIKLWRAVEKRVIKYPRAYIARIVFSAYNNMRREQRRYLQTVQLIVDNDGEPEQGRVMVWCGEGMRDPVEEILEKEALKELIQELVALVSALPPRQKRAMICRLKDRVDDLEMLEKVFEEFGIQIEYKNWPEDRKDRQRLAASISAALKKMTSVF